MDDIVFEERSSGVLLHPASLPGPFGIGDIGPAAHAWIRQLGNARQRYWQVLPLGPTGYGDSPYQSPCSFAGNPNLLSPELLREDGMLDGATLNELLLPSGPIDYGAVIQTKRRMLQKALVRFRPQHSSYERYQQFCREESAWLDDFALFMAVKRSAAERAWTEWPAELARREPAAMDRARRELRDEIELQSFAQFLFSEQWQRLRQTAAEVGVRLIGDLPIFVAGDSSDVWAQPELFQLDADRRPTVVAGVPPDYFSQTGQLWGNPIYDWQRMREDGFAWWVRRLQAALRLVDIIRLDHFRGIQAYWAIPSGHRTAEHGVWLPGPGAELLQAFRVALGRLPIIAEDLGFITQPVEELRTTFGLPGMRILQFAFGGAVEERFLPHRFDSNTIVYTGTHDNDTTAGWFAALTADEKRSFCRYAPEAAQAPIHALIRLAWASVAVCAIVPLQDVLGLDSECRFNKPGTTSGNWIWRLPAELLRGDPLGSLAELGEVYQRNRI